MDKAKIIQIANIVTTGNFANSQRGRIYSIEGVSPTISTMQGGNLQPKIVEILKKYMIKQNKNKGKMITAEIAEQLKLPKWYIGKRFRIRKLTVREVFRLMDMDEENINKLLNAKNEKGQQLISNSQLYKLAGNSIVVSCMEHMFRNLFIGVPEAEKAKQEPIQLNLF
jgi:DNA (cytosine-5)-methyltransferase 1